MAEKRKDEEIENYWVCGFVVAWVPGAVSHPDAAGRKSHGRQRHDQDTTSIASSADWAGATATPSTSRGLGAEGYQIGG
jgi:hypothetical protein